MPKGWPWALRFCQSALTRAAKDAGVGAESLPVDGAAVPPLRADADVVAAGYVDNFATASLDPDVAAAACQAVRDVLEARGIHVGNFAPAAQRVAFTGLDILGDRGAARCKSDRVCRVRLCLLGMFRRGFASPLALAAAVDHCARGASTNRPMLRSSTPRSASRPRARGQPRLCGRPR